MRFLLCLLAFHLTEWTAHYAEAAHALALPESLTNLGMAWVTAFVFCAARDITVITWSLHDNHRRNP